MRIGPAFHRSVFRALFCVHRYAAASTGVVPGLIAAGQKPDSVPQTLVVDPEAEVRRLWTAYFRWLVAHPDETEEEIFQIAMNGLRGLLNAGGTRMG